MKKGYYYVEFDHEKVNDNKGWDVIANEYYEGYPLISSWATESLAEQVASTLNNLIKTALVDELQKDLGTGLMQNPSTFQLTFFAYNDPTYSVTFKNEVGTEFLFMDVYFNEKSMEITQRNVEVRLVSEV